ncbi:GNAT family N-acetyltransferase [Saccharomonospora piscinae]|uniref:GNAT family N-acetyltransferase n=1 Tax=Saccharomonospora piscinae TaxID=687388 RepID=A0A1V9ADP7_SACPI|nr:GNAT family N-acetyltransferase [Saccharomonospora piscinae]OQO95044.1 GNAT family N-acetyltransferase [Saccharomonospora piscinae]
MTETAVTARVAATADLERVVTTYQRSCEDEAVTRWVMSAAPGGQETATWDESLDEAVRGGHVVVADDADGDMVGVSTWLRLDSARPLREQADELAEQVRRRADPVLARTATVLAATSVRHPDTRHLYLASMGVLPRARGRGVGGVLLGFGLAMAAADDRPVYLEASTERNAALYARHGFRPVGEPIALPDGGPRLRPMWRMPPGAGERRTGHGYGS